MWPFAQNPITTNGYINNPNWMSPVSLANEGAFRGGLNFDAMQGNPGGAAGGGAPPAQSPSTAPASPNGMWPGGIPGAPGPNGPGSPAGPGGLPGAPPPGMTPPGQQPSGQGGTSTPPKQPKPPVKPPAQPGGPPFGPTGSPYNQPNLNPGGWPGGMGANNPGAGYAMGQMAQGLADMYASDNALAGALGASQNNAMGNIGVAEQQAGASRYGADQSLAGVRDTNQTGLAGQDLLSGRNLEGQNRATDAGLAAAQAAADAQKNVATQNALAQKYGFDISKAIAETQNAPELAKLDLAKQLLPTLGGGTGLGAGGTGGSAGSTGQPGGVASIDAAPIPAQPRFNALDEEQANARSQSLIARKYAGQKNDLADMYAASGMMPGGRGFRGEMSGLNRQELQDILAANQANRQQGLTFNSQGALGYADQANRMYNAQADRAMQAQQNAILARNGNPLYSLLGSLLG